jgi:hypothetical protein
MKPGSLWRIAVGITPESEEAVTELLSRLFGQPASVCSEVETGTLRAMIFLARRSAWSPRRRAALRAGLQHIRACGLDLGAGRISAAPIPREDWAESWKRHFKPIDVGSRLLIKPSWSRRRPKPGQKVLVLNPGLSFGTGQHPTTGFCLQQLVAARKQDAGQSLLDMGTGSGILAIAGFKLGYRPVVAFDCDPAAVRIARANARRNRAKVRFNRQDLARWATHEPPIQPGRDAFHCVPDLSGRDGDAVERVPTRFMAGEQVRMEPGATHEPVRGRQSAPSPLQTDQSRVTSAATAQGSDHRSTVSCPAWSIRTSRAPDGIGAVNVLPPGQRIQRWVGGSGAASTGTALSWDQYPLPA